MPHLIRAAVLIGLAATPAAADTAFGPARCLVRTYDAAHLAAHRRQHVARIALVRTTEESAAADLVVRVQVTLRDGDAFEGVAYCTDGRCLMEGDAGSFTLRQKPGGFELAVGDALLFENDTRFSPDLARSDDTLFRLQPSARCR